MPEPSTRASEPATSVLLELTSPAAEVLGHDRHAQRQALHETVQQALTTVMATLGVPGRAVVQSRVLPELPSDRFLLVLVNDHQCRYSNDLMQSTRSYLTGQLLQPNATPAAMLEWLRGAGDAVVVEFLARLGVEAIKEQPDVLMTDTHVGAYINALPMAADGKSQAPHLGSVLRNALALRLSLRDRTVVAELCQDMTDAKPETDFCESVIAALRPNRVELRMPSQLLRELTTEWEGVGPELFQFVRNGLFMELGLRYPDFSFVTDDDLRPNTFTFTVNHLTVPPFVSLRAAECLVNESADRIPLLGATAAANPVNRLPQALVPAEHYAQLEKQGFTVWNQSGYFILCLADTLRRHGGCFVDRQTTAGDVDVLSGVAPALVSAVRQRLAADRITAVLRGLTIEQISIRNLRQILETMLDLADAGDSVDPLEAVRTSLQWQIAEKYTRGSDSLVAYLLDSRLESPLRAGPVSPALHDELLHALRSEVDDLVRLYPSAMTPHLLVPQDVRRVLRQLIQAEFPRVSVLSLTEIPPVTNVQPVARIGLA